MPTQGTENNYGDVQKALEEVADGWYGKVVDDLFAYVGPLIVQEMQSLAPVDTGALKNSIRMTNDTQHTCTIVCSVDYAVPVDQGHRTRGGGGFVEAQPFFSSVVGRYTGGELIRQARVKMSDHIEGTFSHYRPRI
jgi:hypothetical protein